MTSTANLILHARNQHDAIEQAIRTRDETIVKLVQSGMSAADVARAMEDRIGDDRVRQICAEFGVTSKGRPGPKPRTARPALP